jgi:hypothetical protein
MNNPIEFRKRLLAQRLEEFEKGVNFSELANEVVNDLEKALRDTSHLQLVEYTDKNGKKGRHWVHKDQPNVKDMELGSKVVFEHKGHLKAGIVSRVAKNGQYGIEHNGELIHKSPHQMKKNDLVKIDKEKPANALPEGMTILPKEDKLIWKHASDLKPGDTHQYEDSNGKKVISVVKNSTPYKNGFGEVIGATITWNDGSKDVYRGDLQIIDKNVEDKSHLQLPAIKELTAAEHKEQAKHHTEKANGYYKTLQDPAIRDHKIKKEFTEKMNGHIEMAKHHLSEEKKKLEGETDKEFENEDKAKEFIDKHIEKKSKETVTHKVGSRPAKYITPYEMHDKTKTAAIKGVELMLDNPKDALEMIEHFETSIRGSKAISFSYDKEGKPIIEFNTTSDDYDKWNGKSSEKNIDSDMEKWHKKGYKYDGRFYKVGKMNVEVGLAVSSTAHLDQNYFTTSQIKSLLKESAKDK